MVGVLLSLVCVRNGTASLYSFVSFLYLFHFVSCRFLFLSSLISSFLGALSLYVCVCGVLLLQLKKTWFILVRTLDKKSVCLPQLNENKIMILFPFSFFFLFFFSSTYTDTDTYT